jgi:glycyl-tRNA synthetase
MAAASMQDAILALTEYWAAQGCSIVQPYNTEVGAGTLNPATFLRVLGPEPWRVAYVEPSVRPDDSRYGDNPNRIQTHTQFQVILKPEPGDAQDRYLRSLAVLGVDLAAHDVRFVEDNWASPALGAWGLGWEVWLDGLEITQFTYFQQAGGFSLDPVSVEITYGLERIVMALQGVSHFKDIEYAPGISYGDVFGQAEYEWSRYYLDDADVAAVGDLFERYELEAQRLIELRLPVPAYSYVLKCSHTFNVLDARGAVSPTERARSFGRMRRLAHQVAELWVQRREEEGFPLGRWEPPAPAPVRAPAHREAPPGGGEGADRSMLAFEIGTEEMPAGEVPLAGRAVGEALAAKLKATRLAHGDIAVQSSPRRIVAFVDRVAPKEEDAVETRRGPKRSLAFDSDGRPTPAASGFARSNGVSVDDLAVVEANGVEYVAVSRHVTGRPAETVLADVLAGVVTELRSSETNMRWRSPGLSFSRPVRWLLALLGDRIVPVVASDLAAGRHTWVLRKDPSPRREVDGAEALAGVLGHAGIVTDGERRREAVAAQARQLAGRAGGTVELDSASVEEVAHLVEAPHAILGRFDPAYLDLPPEILVTVMRKHQRYFPIRGQDGQLIPAFIAVANGPCDEDAVRKGNESVLRARYEDARFFWQEDLGKSPDEFRSRLYRLTFADRLGSIGDRADRIAKTATELGHLVWPGGSPGPLQRAAGLAKFDLATQMVMELTSLAGAMAREYALRAGEPPEVAEALFEMELPRQAGDALPRSLAGSVLSVADRADLLAGLFAAGVEPSGSSDPFGLRRAALGLLAVLTSQPQLQPVSVELALDTAGAHQPVDWNAGVRQRALEFVARRWETQQLDAGRAPQAVRAVLPRFSRPAAAEKTLTWLVAHLDDPTFAEVARALGRATRIVPPGTEAGWDPSLPSDPAEDGLRRAIAGLEEVAAGGDLDRFVEYAQSLVSPIDRFFDEVLVMADDPGVRANRLGLLARIRDAAGSVIDWTQLE